MSEKTQDTQTNLSAGTSQPALPPFIPDGDNYIRTKKQNVLWKAVEGLGFGWGAAVGVGSIIEFFTNLRKPRGPGRFNNLIVSDTVFRQSLDAIGMALGALTTTVQAIQHNKKIKEFEKSHAEEIQTQKAEKDTLSSRGK